MMMKALAFGLTMAMVAFPSEAKEPSQLTAHYEFFVGGFRIAEVALSASANDSNYVARSNVVTRGVLEVLLRGRSASQASGTRGAFGQLVPTGYSTQYSSRTGDQTTRIGYDGTSPSSVVFEPQATDSEDHAGISERAGSLDPLSAALAALMPTKATDLCNRTIPIFDGKRRFDIIFLPPDPARFDDSAPSPKWSKPLTRCLGVYERISGFGKESLQNQRYFPFDIWFEDSGNDVFRAVRIAGSTKLGFAIGNLRPGT